MKETVKMKTRFAILLAAVMCMTLAAGAQPTKRDVDLTAADGAKLKASYYSPGRPGPGVLLLHQCNRDRASWEGLAAQLVERGIHVVTLDYRGYGESGGERYTTDAGRAALRANWFSDVDIALAYLISQSGVDKSRLGAGGASCGVNQSIQLARRNPAVKSLALLSGSTNEEGAEFLRGSRGIGSKFARVDMVLWVIRQVAQHLVRAPQVLRRDFLPRQRQLDRGRKHHESRRLDTEKLLKEGVCELIVLGAANAVQEDVA